MRSQVRTSVAFLALAALGFAWWSGTTDLRRGAISGVAGLAVVAAYGWWSLRRGRHTPWEEARARIAPGHAVVLWKPGCPYCERLLRALGDDGRVTWVNVWHDAAAQTRVCELNDGDEYTPTVLVGDAVLRNPAAAQVRAALGSPA